MFYSTGSTRMGNVADNTHHSMQTLSIHDKSIVRRYKYFKLYDDASMYVST